MNTIVNEMATTRWEWSEETLQRVEDDTLQRTHIDDGRKDVCIVPISGGMHSTAAFQHVMEHHSASAVPIPLHIVQRTRPDAARARAAFNHVCDTIADPWGNLCKFAIVLHADDKGEKSIVDLAQRVAAMFSPKAIVFRHDTALDGDDSVAAFRRYLIKSIEPQAWSERDPMDPDWDHEHVEVLDKFNVCPQSTEALAKGVGAFAHVCDRSFCAPCVRALGLVAEATDGCLVDREFATQNHKHKLE